MLPLMALGALGAASGSGFPLGLDAGTQASSSAPVSNMGGAGWNVQASPFTIASGGSTMEGSGLSKFDATQYYTPRTELSASASNTATPSNLAPAYAPYASYPELAGTTFSVPSLAAPSVGGRALPLNPYVIGAAVIGLGLIVFFIIRQK